MLTIIFEIKQVCSPQHSSRLRQNMHCTNKAQKAHGPENGGFRVNT